MGRQKSMVVDYSTKCAIVIVIALFVLTHNIDVVESKRIGSNQRKTSSNSNSGHVTPQTYNTNSGSSGSNSHADVAKLSYPNYNSQPNRPASANTHNENSAPIGWNVPKQQGPPPAYSASNPVGGAKTSLNEPPPAYHAPNYGAAPPSYGASNVHSPITASNAHGTQYGAPPAGATYHSPNNLPPGASYYPSGSHVPAGGSYYPQGGNMPYGGGYHPQGGQLPAGASYYPAGGALPQGATYYAQPPQSSSSGLGFGTGLIAGGLGGALLGHALTPSGGSQVQQAPAAAAGGGGSDRIIIINNGGMPTNVTEAGAGTTVINAAGGGQPTTDSAAAAVTPPSLAPFANSTNNNQTEQQPQQQAPPPGGIICVPVRVNETDPADSTKMIEIEKIACYPAPQPEQQPAGGSAPLAPMQPPVAPAQNSQQMQQHPAQSTLLANESNMHSKDSNGAANLQTGNLCLMAVTISSFMITHKFL